MAVDEREVLHARQLRHAAREVFEARKDLIRDDLGAAGIGKRVATRLAEDGRAITRQAAATADRHRTALAALVLAATGWIFRKPLGAFAAFLLDRAVDVRPDSPAPTDCEADPSDT